MRNSFARNLNTLLAETISDSLVRMRNHNNDYAKMISKGDLLQLQRTRSYADFLDFS